MHRYLIELGSMGDMRTTISGQTFERGSRLLVRTDRGVELATVRGRSTPRELRDADSDVVFLRATTSEDELLLERLKRHKREAVEECREALAAAGSPAVLLDVDQLFDGGTLVLHFLGPTDSFADDATRRVVERYESIVRTGEFAELLANGCGPACGSEEASGCGGNCSGCSAAAACATSSRRSRSSQSHT